MAVQTMFTHNSTVSSATSQACKSNITKVCLENPYENKTIAKPHIKRVCN